MRKFVQDGYIVIKLSDLSILNSSSVFIFCMKFTLNNSDKMEFFSHAGVEHRWVNGPPTSSVPELTTDNVLYFVMSSKSELVRKKKRGSKQKKSNK